MLLLFLLLLLSTTVSSKLNGEGNLCGRPFGANLTLEDRIVGGYDVGYYKYPWYVALWVQDFVACGGSLVGNKMVITAAHCFKEYVIPVHNKTSNTKLENVYQVVIGIYNKCIKEQTQKTYKVEKVYIHEKYKDLNPYYDIALLVLTENTEPLFQPICLPRRFYKVRPRDGTVIGMGTLKYHGGTPCTLHEARILLYKDQQCKDMLNRTGNDPTKLYGAFCAGYLQGGTDTCQGDSGGPLQVMDEYGNNILLGIVSFGFHCANPGLLGLYTDVSKYVDWIEEKTGMKASIEDTNSTQSSGTLPSDIAATSTTARTTKKTHKHHQFMMPWTGWNPVNIFIFNKKFREDRKHKNKN